MATKKTSPKNNAKKEAIAKIAENVAKIEELIDECEKLSAEMEIPFSLQDMGYMTTDEMYDQGWSDSNC